MIKQLIKLANHLDRIGYIRESNYLDAIIKNSSIGDDNNEDSGVISFEGYLDSAKQRARNINPTAKKEEVVDRNFIYIKTDDKEELVTKDAMVALISEEEHDDIRFGDQEVSKDTLISVKMLIEFYMDNKKWLKN